MLVLPSLPAVGQAVVEIPRQPGCRGCTIEIQRIATLGDEDGAGIIEGDRTYGVADSRGRYFLFMPYTPRVKAYDARGGFLKALGREGRGPGEFRGVGIVSVSAGDTVHVFDGNNLTHSVFSPSLQFVRSTQLEVPPQVEAVVLGGNQTIIATSLRTPDRVGLPLHLLERGRVVRSFGSESGAFRPDIPYFGDRAVAPADPGRVWSAHNNRYQIELWSTDGRKLREFRRSVDWFPPYLRSRPLSPSRVPPTTLQQVWQDREGRLWVRMLVPDQNWRQAVRQGGPHGYTIQDRHEYYDTVIEVIDPERGRILVSRRIPEVVHFMGEDRLGAVVMDPNGVPRYVVWRMRIVSPSSRRSE